MRTGIRTVTRSITGGSWFAGSVQRSIVAAHFGLSEAADNQQFPEARADLVYFADLESRDVEAVKVAVAGLWQFDNADAHVSAYRREHASGFIRASVIRRIVCANDAAHRRVCPGRDRRLAWPIFGEQEFGFIARNFDDLADAPACEIDPIYELGKFRVSRIFISARILLMPA